MRPTPEKIDKHVGVTLRFLRKAQGFTQAQLANRVGLTFQQVQKYEKGSNRISASKLWQFCEALDATPNDFFQGLAEQQSIASDIAYGKVAEAAMQLHQLENTQVKQNIMELIRQISRKEASEPNL